MSEAGMRLLVLVPVGILLDRPVDKVIAEAEDGSFCLLPRHVDFVAALVPGILYAHTLTGEDLHLATDEGVLVKCGREVRVSVRDAVLGPGLAGLAETVERRFRVRDEQERRARSAVARLEVGVVRRFLGLGEARHG
jgi:F-type H+-transporting ATPase subunit epsilon